jgi:uncharacterized protein YjiS (DUF1127 family)
MLCGEFACTLLLVPRRSRKMEFYMSDKAEEVSLSASPGRLICPQENSSKTAVAMRTVGLWWDRWRRRRSLRELAERDNHLLADVGLTREAALREACKPFWRS